MKRNFYFFFVRYLLSKGFARLNKWFVLPVNDHSDVKVYVENILINKKFIYLFIFNLDLIFLLISIFSFMVIIKYVQV
jgi:hypothetical protein